MLDGIHPFNNDIIMTFTQEPRTFTFTRFSNGYTQTFTPSDRVIIPMNQRPEYKKKIDATNYDYLFMQQLSFNKVPLDYVRYTASTLQVSSSQLCVLGVNTAPSDFPTGIVDFPTAAFLGTAYDRSSGSVVTYSVSADTMQIRLNRTAGTLSLSAHLTGTRTDSTPDKDYGTISGTASIDWTTGGYSGTLTSSMSSVTVEVAGTFFGPQAKEFGLAFNMRRPTGAPGDFDLIATGLAQGTR